MTAPLYQLTPNPVTGDMYVTLTTTNQVIPADNSKPAWKTYLAWVAAGNTPTPAPVVAPSSCQLWQLQSVLTTAQWTALQAAIVALNNPAVTAFLSHGTAQIPAASTTVISLGASIGLSAAQVAALVAEAAAVAIP